MANRVFPGGPLGLFDVSLPATHWDATGTQIGTQIGTHWDATGTQIEDVEDVPPIHPERTVRLNAVAVGDALYHAHEADPTGACCRERGTSRVPRNDQGGSERGEPHRVAN